MDKFILELYINPGQFFDKYAIETALDLEDLGLIAGDLSYDYFLLHFSEEHFKNLLYPDISWEDLSQEQLHHIYVEESSSCGYNIRKVKNEKDLEEFKELRELKL